MWGMHGWPYKSPALRLTNCEDCDVIVMYLLYNLKMISAVFHKKLQILTVSIINLLCIPSALFWFIQHVWPVCYKQGVCLLRVTVYPHIVNLMDSF